MKYEKEIKDYEAAVNTLAEIFLNKQFGEDTEEPITIDGKWAWWAGDEVGDVLFYGDWGFNFNDILTDIKEDASIGELDKYNKYCTRCIDLGLESWINYHAWLRGAPRTPDETLDRLERMKKNLTAEIEKAKNEKNF